LNRLRSEEYALLRKAVDQRIDDILVGLTSQHQPQAAAAHLLELLAAEGLSPKPVTDAEVQIASELTRDRYPGFSAPELSQRLRSDLEARRLAASRETLLHTLRTKTQVGILIHPPHIALETQGKPAQGPSGAPVTMVVMSDFECPFCAKASETIRTLMKNYPEQIRLVFITFP